MDFISYLVCLSVPTYEHEIVRSANTFFVPEKSSHLKYGR